MGIMIPSFQKMQKEGESGRRKMNPWTRMLTIIVLLIQGPAYITNLYRQVPCLLYTSPDHSICFAGNRTLSHYHNSIRDI